MSTIRDMHSTIAEPTEERSGGPTSSALLWLGLAVLAVAGAWMLIGGLGGGPERRP